MIVYPIGYNKSFCSWIECRCVKVWWSVLLNRIMNWLHEMIIGECCILNAVIFYFTWYKIGNWPRNEAELESRPTIVLSHDKILLQILFRYPSDLTATHLRLKALWRALALFSALKSVFSPMVPFKLLKLGSKLKWPIKNNGLKK